MPQFRSLQATNFSIQIALDGPSVGQAIITIEDSKMEYETGTYECSLRTLTITQAELAELHALLIATSDLTTKADLTKTLDTLDSAPSGYR